MRLSQGSMPNAFWNIFFSLVLLFVRLISVNCFLCFPLKWKESAVNRHVAWFVQRQENIMAALDVTMAISYICCISLCYFWAITTQCSRQRLICVLNGWNSNKPSFVQHRLVKVLHAGWSCDERSTTMLLTYFLRNILPSKRLRCEQNPHILSAWVNRLCWDSSLTCTPIQTTQYLGISMFSDSEDIRHQRINFTVSLVIFLLCWQDMEAFSALLTLYKRTHW